MALLLIPAASASAKEIHVVKDSFGGGELSVEANSGISLNQETEVLYVSDTFNERVLSYATSGMPLGSLGTFAAPTFVAVDNSPGAGQGDIYVVETGGTENLISKVTAAGAPVTSWGNGGHLGSVGTIAGIAVDDSGYLWVFNTEGRLRSYAPDFVSGDEVESDCTLEENLGGGIHGISVDGLGRIYATRSEGQLRALNSACESLANELISVSGTAVDPADNSLFATEEFPSHVEISEERFVVLEEKIGLSTTNEGISREEGEGRAGSGQLAVDPVGGRLFAVVPDRDEIFDFGIENVEPPILEGPGVSEVTGTSAKLTAHIDPHRPLEANALPYAVSYQFKCTPSCLGGFGTVPGDQSNHLIEFTGTGLEPGTKYEVELIARNAGGTASAGPINFTTGAVAPSSEKPSIMRVTDTEATVEASINPGGTEASYQFEYVTLAQYEASQYAEALKTTPQSLAASGKSELVVATIKGLIPGTPYKVRAVVSNTIEADVPGPEADFITQESSVIAGNCPNDTFRIGPGAFLPDCRGYEQATPVDKNGGSVAGSAGLVQASENGAAISYYSQAGVPGGVGSQDFPTFVASRGTSSWANQGLLPPQALGEGASVLGVTSNDRNSISLVIRGSQIALAYRDLENDEARLIVPYRPSCAAIARCFAYAGSSLDGSQVFFESTLPVTDPPAEPGTEVEHPNLYMWNIQTEQLALVGRNASGEALPEGSIAGPYDWKSPDRTRGGPSASYYTGAVHAISNSGDQAVFTEAGTGQLFARVGLDGLSPSTVHVSESQTSSEESPRPAAFLEATPDGKFIFFKSRQRLTEDAGNGVEEASWNLYRYEVATGDLLDITPKDPINEESGPEVQGLVGTSADGQVAYFVARGKLTAEAAPEEENLYRFDATEDPTLTFIATLEGQGPYSDADVWNPQGDVDRGRTARVSADGDAIVFGSHSSLTSFENQASGCTNSSTGVGPCLEFYRWTPTTKAPECLSCDATGALPLGPASLTSPFINTAIPPKIAMAPIMSRNLSADGTRFFFQTPDPLSARDTNADAGCPFFENSPSNARCMDVYQWEAAGSGNCAAAVVAGGCVSLLSSGISSEPSYFGDADREGDNTFLFTSSQLVPADRDRLYDIYDVAVGGGLASQWEVPGPPCASPEACLGSRTQASQGATPGSASFNGPGNQKDKPKCRKHSKKKCKQHKKNHHKKKHHKKKRDGGSHSAAPRTENFGGGK